MKRLLSIEFLKLRTYRPFWITSILYFVLIIIMSLSLQGIISEIMSNKAVPPGMKPNILSFPLAWHNMTYLLGYLHVIPGMLIIITICNESSFKTIRQSTINGLKRSEFFLSKFLIALALVFSATVLVFFAITLLGLVNDGTLGASYFRKIGYIGSFFLQMMGYMSVAIFLGVWIRRAGFAIITFFMYALFLEDILYWQIRNWDFLPMWLTYLLPIESMDKLIRSPFLALIDGSDMPDFDFIAIAVAIGYIGLFLGLSYRILKKRDL